MFRSLWAYRGFVWSSVLREFNGKYRESLFGAFWSVASPTLAATAVAWAGYARFQKTRKGFADVL